MSATTRTLADLGQENMVEGDLGYHLLETVLDGDLDPQERDIVRALVRVWSYGKCAYFGVSPHGAVEAATEGGWR